MRITIKVVPRAKKNCIKKEPDYWKVYVTAPAIEGRANEAVVEILSETWGVKKSQIEIIKGLKSRIKIITLKGDFHPPLS